MPTRVAGPVPGRDWLSLTDATRILGVSASTLRRWADTGAVRTFVTPGGHRRFSRSGIEALLPAEPVARPSLASLGETTARMSRLYRTAAWRPARLPWIDELDEARRERFRAHGRTIVGALLASLDAEDEGIRREALRAADDACAEYGRVAGREGLAATATLDLFLRFRRPFLAELQAMTRRRELDAAAACRLIADATDALDELLLATLRGWEGATVAPRRFVRHAPTHLPPGAPPTTHRPRRAGTTAGRGPR